MDMSCDLREPSCVCMVAESRPQAAIHAEPRLPARGALLWKALVMGLFLFVAAAPPVAAQTTGFRSPNDENQSPNMWTNRANAKAFGGGAASESTPGDEEAYADFQNAGNPNTGTGTLDSAIPPGSVITGIEVQINAAVSTPGNLPACTVASHQIDVALSWNAGVNYTAFKSQYPLTPTLTYYTLGGPLDTWGRTWTQSEFTNANFVAKVRYTRLPPCAGGSIALDHIQVRVWYAPACVPTTEICNGLDDDCDGSVDEGTSGAPTTCGIGACTSTGVTTCTAGVPGNTCTPGTPSSEVCNGLDDNCNGTVDEGTSGAPTTCGVGACTSIGMTTCTAGTPGDTCTPGTPSSEVCNGLDDNCNGTVDEGTSGAPTTCGVGACTSTGVTTCTAGVPGDSCSPGTPSPEVCNGLDDDCDGGVDEGNPGGGLACVVAGNLGQCAIGTTACTSGAIVCNQNNEPASETCDGLDNDCDGDVDEGTTTCGIGACTTTVPMCVDGKDNTCTPGTPGTEVCNGIDDDCDGQVDEDGCKVTGGGQITCDNTTGEPCSDGEFCWVSFGFNVQTKAGNPPPIKGQLEFNRHTAPKATYHSLKIETLDVTPIACTADVNGLQATFTGTIRKKGQTPPTEPCRFEAVVKDCGEPGRNDYFSIHITGPVTDPTACEETRSGVLDRGNIQIH
jgi:putative metal-binding protein